MTFESLRAGAVTDKNCVHKHKDKDKEVLMSRKFDQKPHKERTGGLDHKTISSQGYTELER